MCIYYGFNGLYRNIGISNIFWFEVYFFSVIWCFCIYILVVLVQFSHVHLVNVQHQWIALLIIGVCGKFMHLFIYIYILFNKYGYQNYSYNYPLLTIGHLILYCQFFCAITLLVLTHFSYHYYFPMYITLVLILLIKALGFILWRCRMFQGSPESVFI